MLSFTGGLKVFIALEPCDLRKSFNGLHALVSERLGEDPRQGGLFVFTNRRKTRLKILYWDGTGLWVLIKRLEEGSFGLAKSVDPAASSCGWPRRRWPCSPTASNCAEQGCVRGTNGSNHFHRKFYPRYLL